MCKTAHIEGNAAKLNMYANTKTDRSSIIIGQRFLKSQIVYANTKTEES